MIPIIILFLQLTNLSYYNIFSKISQMKFEQGGTYTNFITIESREIVFKRFIFKVNKQKESSILYS